MAILDATASRFRDVALLIGRILIGVLFLIAAYNKAKGYGGAVGYFTKLGVPAAGVVAPLTILFEAAAGILLIIGYQTRLVAMRSPLSALRRLWSRTPTLPTETSSIIC